MSPCRRPRLTHRSSDVPHPSPICPSTAIPLTGHTTRPTPHNPVFPLAAAQVRERGPQCRRSDGPRCRVGDRADVLDEGLVYSFRRRGATDSVGDCHWRRWGRGCLVRRWVAEDTRPCCRDGERGGTTGRGARLIAEPTSALDAESSKKVERTLLEMLPPLKTRHSTVRTMTRWSKGRRTGLTDSRMA